MKTKKILGFLLLLFHYCCFRIKIPATNKLTLGNNVLLWKSKINVFGKKNSVIIGKNVNLKKTNIIVQGSNNKILILDNVKIYEHCNVLIEGNDCEIYIGSNTTIGSADIFCGEGETAIFIGENCMMSRSVSMNTSDFHSILNTENLSRINPPKSIYIGNHVWLGFSCTIKKGAKIKDDCIIASHSVVTGRDYPGNVILGGTPAKILKENITWSREKLPY